MPVGAGTDATRVASYNPWVSLSWLVTGKTLGGLTLYPAANRLDRETALRLWTEANTWFSNEAGKKGQIKAGQLADLAVLSDDYFSVPEDAIQDITSVLTLLGGKPVHGDGDFEDLAPPLPPPMPDWSPVRTYRRLPAAGRQWRGSASTPSRRPTAAAPVPAASTATRTPAPWAPTCRPRTRARSGARSAAPAGRSDREAAMSDIAVPRPIAQVLALPALDYHRPPRPRGAVPDQRRREAPRLLRGHERGHWAGAGGRRGRSRPR